MGEEVFHGGTDVLNDLPQQRGRNITSLVQRDGGAPAVGVTILDMGTSLPHRHETQPLQNTADLGGFQDGDVAHGLGNTDGLRADKFTLKLGLAVLQQHGDNFTEVGLQFIKRLRLGMSAGKTRNVTDQQAGVGIALDDRGVIFHAGDIRQKTPEGKSRTGAYFSVAIGAASMSAKT